MDILRVHLHVNKKFSFAFLKVSLTDDNFIKLIAVHTDPTPPAVLLLPDQSVVMPLCEETLRERIIRMQSLFSQINVFIVCTEMIMVSFSKTLTLNPVFKSKRF